ncbi:MAG TPA: glycine cleavage system aminomethyltransferase GcvT [Acidimicrobiia bacterium]|nr:glycine cleavage system aminomethyltransferase GcvT [Acidimicrobiia bacterium]
MPETPLRAVHAELGARFTEFAGWEMPLQYEGVVAEHMAVRNGAGVFDVTHLGRFQVFGPGATDLVRRQLCNDISTVDPGRAQYTMALNESGGVEDDIIVWRIGDEDYWVLPNGANFDEIVARFAGSAPEGVAVTPVRSSTVLLAVQGPGARGVVEAVLASSPGRFRVTGGEYRNEPYWAAGTGYTGERGAEIAVPEATGPALLRDLVAAGATPCGLGARDTLRLEMGYPLWGQDLDEFTTPLEAGLGWVVDWDHEFIGRSALDQQRRDGVSKQLVGFKLAGRRVPRPGYDVKVGESFGAVASGNFSPVLGCGIGMGYVSPPSDSADVAVDIRGTWHDATRVDPPFIDV